MNQLEDSWKDIRDIIAFGWGNVGKKSIDKLMADFNVIQIIDNEEEKQGEYRGIKITSLKNALEIVRQNKIIVMTNGKVYLRIKEELQGIGMKEYRDFCSIERFISEWYWKYKNQNCILEIHTAVTMRCTLKCRNCNMFVPYYKEKIDYAFEEIKQDYDLLFQFVDYVFCIELLGGEPLLNRDLGRIILYLSENYGNRIGAIGIVTNGSVVPDDNLLAILSKCHVTSYISDYTGTVPYKKKLGEVISVYKEKGLRYEIRQALQWKDFGIPCRKGEHQSESVRKHMLTCAPLFHGLNDKKYFFCHVAWSAEKAGFYKLTENDFIDLCRLAVGCDNDKRKLIYHSMGENLQQGYVSLCQVCGGCGEDNLIEVNAGEQYV